MTFQYFTSFQVDQTFQFLFFYVVTDRDSVTPVMSLLLQKVAAYEL